MDARTRNRLLLLFGVGTAAAYLWFTQSGRKLASEAGSIVATGVERVADLTDSTLQFIKRFEGFSAKPYWDRKGWSIGYGHFMGPRPTMQEISEPEAYELLRTDTANFADAVKRSVNVALTQNQFDALTSFAYNEGISAFQGSTLLRKINSGDMAGASAEFAKWNKARDANGNLIVLNDLTERRAAEAQLFVA